MQPTPQNTPARPVPPPVPEAHSAAPADPGAAAPKAPGTPAAGAPAGTAAEAAPPPAERPNEPSAPPAPIDGEAATNAQNLPVGEGGQGPDAPTPAPTARPRRIAAPRPGFIGPPWPPRVQDEHITRRFFHGKEYVLIATAHVSPESAELVRRVIELEHPDSVCVELDPGRYQSIKNPGAFQNTSIVDVIRQKRVGLMLANLALSAYQKRMAKQLGSTVGGEMLAGIEGAEATGAELVLADRSVQTTFMRIWRMLGAREKVKLLASLLMGDEEDISEQDLADLMQKDSLEGMLAELHDEFPQVGEVLLNERDRFLAAKIVDAPGPRVVAVLGGAHVPGVAKALGRPRTGSLEEINTVPKGKPVGKIIAWAIPLLVVGLIVYGFATSLQTGLAQLSAWVLWNSGLAGAFTLLAGGHPLTVLTAFVLAPFTSLNPLLACGWFAGLCEATLRKPRVGDLQTITEDITSLKGFYHNRFLRTLLVVILANIGSTMGTIVAGIMMARIAL